jgi:hypothetical protein
MDMASILNVSNEFEHDGKKYKIAELTIVYAAMYSQWLKDRAMIAVDQMYQGRLDDPRYPVDRLQVINDSASGAYDWGGELSLKSLQTPTGAAKALELSILQEGGTIVYGEASALLQAKQKEMLVHLQKIAGNPKKLSALVASLIGPTLSKRSPTPRTHARKKKLKR